MLAGARPSVIDVVTKI